MHVPAALCRAAARCASCCTTSAAGSAAISSCCVAVLAAVGCAIGSQYGVKNLVDMLGRRPPDERQPVDARSALLLGLVAGDHLLWRLAGWVASYVFVAVGGDLRLELFEHLSGHGARYFADRFPGALAGRITTAANAAWTIENSLAWTTIPPATAVLSSIAVLGIIDWQMAVRAVRHRGGARRGDRRLRRRQPHLHDALRRPRRGGQRRPRRHRRQYRARPRLRRRPARAGAAVARIEHEMSAQRASLQSLERVRLFHAVSVFAVTAGVLAWSVALWRAGRDHHRRRRADDDAGLHRAACLARSRHGAGGAAAALRQAGRGGAGAGPAARDAGCARRPAADQPGRRGHLRRMSVSAIPSGERVLQDFNLHIPAGERVGLVGRSGAGKSTVLALLQRLYDPERGHVLIDEQDIAKVTQESLRQSIAVVQQDISLFHRSVLENLRYGKPDATDAEVYRAAEAAHCTEFIERLPQGFDTIVGERGLKLSGGERQRLAIARAFLRDAPIILLDEATSALDTESEQAIQEALTRLVNGRTVIAIAHRLSTLNAFDRIVVLDRGRIVEEGSPAELLRRKGVYSRMYAGQLSAGDPGHGRARAPRAGRPCRRCAAARRPVPGAACIAVAPCRRGPATAARGRPIRRPDGPAPRPRPVPRAVGDSQQRVPTPPAQPAAAKPPPDNPRAAAPAGHSDLGTRSQGPSARIGARRRCRRRRGGRSTRRWSSISAASSASAAARSPSTGASCISGRRTRCADPAASGRAEVQAAPEYEPDAEPCGCSGRPRMGRARR